MGLYMVNERSGKLGEPVHPFGPGGEGGRDDAIYSSPANLQVNVHDVHHEHKKYETIISFVFAT